MAKIRITLLHAAVSGTLLIVLVMLVILSQLMSSEHLPSAYAYIKASISSSVLPSGNLSFSTGPCNCSLEVLGAVGSGSALNPKLDCKCESCPPATAAAAAAAKQVQAVQNVIRYQPWWAEGKVWHYPVKFPRCSMDACFNYSRCSHANELKIYTYDNHNPPVRYFQKLNETKWHTSDPNEACIFLVFLDNDHQPWKRHPRELLLWNNGLNHALVTFADKWAQRMVPEDSIGKASLVVSEAHETVFRPGFDISIPLPPHYHFTEFQRLKPLDRRYLITFKGLRYIGNRGEGTLRSLDSFRNIHNGDDIIVVTSCKHFINDLIRKENSSTGVHCDSDNELYSKFPSYSELMNTTFGLVPAGVQPNSYRFAEVLGAGAIPILVADNYVKPFSGLVSWHSCLLQFPSTEMDLIVKAVRSMSTRQMEQRQRACLRIYNAHFRDDSTLLESTVAALEERFLGALPAFSSHLWSLYSE